MLPTVIMMLLSSTLNALVFKISILVCLRNLVI